MGDVVEPAPSRAGVERQHFECVSCGDCFPVPTSNPNVVCPNCGELRSRFLRLREEPLEVAIRKVLNRW